MALPELETNVKGKEFLFIADMNPACPLQSACMRVFIGGRAALL